MTPEVTAVGGGWMTRHHGFRALSVAVDAEPAQILRHMAARREYEQAQQSPDAEADAPANIDRENVRIEQHQRCARAERRADPEAALMMSATRPHTRAGTNSSIAELTAAYSPPMPSPVTQRQTAMLAKSHEKAVSRVPVRYTARVAKSNRKRP